MPALRLFGRAWGWSSDDFCCPGVSLVLLRCFTTAALAGAWSALADVGQCSSAAAADMPVGKDEVVRFFGSGGGAVSAVPWFDTGRHCPVELLLSYARAMLLLQAAEALVEGAAGIVSLRGSVMDPNNRRRCAAPLAYVRAVLSVLELMGTVLGLQLSFKQDVEADDGYGLQLLERCGCGQNETAGARFVGDDAALTWPDDATDAVDTAVMLLQLVTVGLSVLSCLVACMVCCTHHKLKREQGTEGEGGGGQSASDDANLHHRCGKRLFWSHCEAETDLFPRQARDNRRNSWFRRKGVFCRLGTFFSSKMKCCIDDLHFPQLPGSGGVVGGGGGRAGSGEANPIGLLAEILSSYFRGISRNDFVATDVFAAVILVAQSQKFSVLHPVLEAAKLEQHQRLAVAAADASSDSHLSLAVVSKLGLKGAEARVTVQKAKLLQLPPKSPLSAMVFAAFEGVRAEPEQADPQPLGVDERARVVGSAEHYLKYALGSYGWMLYAYRKGGRCFSTAPCAIGELCPCPCCCCSRQQRFYGEGGSATGYKDDNCCRTNHTALLRTVWEFGGGGGQDGKGPNEGGRCGSKSKSGLPPLPPPRSECRVVYASWANTLLLKPYAIAIDRRTKTVVLSVRGA